MSDDRTIIYFPALDTVYVLVSVFTFQFIYLANFTVFEQFTIMFMQWFALV